MADTSPADPVLVSQRWIGSTLHPVDVCSVTDEKVLAADSWLVVDGRVLALDAHRTRFLSAVELTGSLSPADTAGPAPTEAEEFWDAAVQEIPRIGTWFPRVDLVETAGRRELRFLLRPAPERTRSVAVATHRGRDPRTVPTIKGPDLAAMMRLRSEAQQKGAGEAIIVSPEGYLVEGAYSALAWWRGDVLCFPADDLDRVDSVTARILETLARALGVETVREHVTANEIDGLEVWAMSALQGFRIVTSWVGGPSTAELPGRLDLWRRRAESLRRPLPAV